MNNDKHVSRRMVVMMSLAVALALIAFVSPISAVPVGTHDITFVGKTSDGAGNSIWTYNVTTGCSPSLSHWSLGFCGEEADILEVSEAWEYHTDTYDSVDITGVKFEEGYECDDEDGPEIRTVWFKLEGDWPEGSVEVGTKAGSDKPGKVATALGSVTGPVCNVGEPIPEFATITIPIVALLGLLAFYRRKQKK